MVVSKTQPEIFPFNVVRVDDANIGKWRRVYKKGVGEAIGIER